MEHTRLREALAGVSVTTATAFSENLKDLDSSGIAKNLRFLADEGIGMVVPCGNTGEFYSLSESEWTDVVRTTVDIVGNKMVVMAGVGHSITTTIDMMSQAKNLGAGGVMVMYPQHVFSSEEGIFHYYQQILDASDDIGVVLYKKGALLSDAVLGKLIGHKNLVGVKYAFGRIVDFANTIQTLGKSIIWSCGTAERFAPFFWLAGAQGFTSGLGNFAPHVSRGMFDALKKSEYDEAMRIQAMISALEFQREGRGAANNVPVIKALLDHIGLAGGLCRAPIHPLSENERVAAVESIKGWDLKYL
ncbi:MAG: dihydrodipicolinate synthase family protein [Candidatus Thorarchaeota archaeon]|jgi:4-hydroxy-tetrahydrodipicolinate synthase